MYCFYGLIIITDSDIVWTLILCADWRPTKQLQCSKSCTWGIPRPHRLEGSPTRIATAVLHAVAPSGATHLRHSPNTPTRRISYAHCNSSSPCCSAIWCHPLEAFPTTPTRKISYAHCNSSSPCCSAIWCHPLEAFPEHTESKDLLRALQQQFSML